MKKILLVIWSAAMLVAGISLAGPVKDWRDLDKVHNHVQQAIQELDRARAANHYDMEGHGVKAEQALHEAERELQGAIDWAHKNGH